jgi:tetratricopeptide (TPR) repeat protein
MYTRLEKYDIALELYTKVRNICKEHHGEDAESYIDAVIDVAKIYKRLKEFKTAFQLQLAMLEKIRMNKNKDKFAEALSELADTFSK